MNSVLSRIAAVSTSEKSPMFLLCSIVFILLPQLAAAQEESDSEAPQDFMEALIEQTGLSREELEASGMTPEMMEQMNQAMQQSGAMDYGAAAQQAEEDKKQAKHEASTAGFGSASVSFDGAEHELQVTSCEYYDEKGSFAIKAQKSRNPESGLLNVNSQVGSNSTVTFWLGDNEYEAYVQGFDFDGQHLEWEGTVKAGFDKKPLSFSLTCRE